MRLFFDRLREYGLYVLIFLLPWQTRWIWERGMLNGGTWEYGTFSLYAFDILLLAILLLTLFHRQRIGPISRRWLVLLGAFFLVCFISIFWSVNKGVSWYAAVRLLEGLALVYVIATVPLRWRRVSTAFVTAGVLQSALAIFQFFSQHISANKWLGMASHDPSVLGDFVIETTSGRFLRAYGSFPHPNMLAGFLVVCLLVVIGFLFAMYRDRRPRIAHIVMTVTSFVVIYYGLILTFSRAAWLAFALAVFFLLGTSIIWRNRHRVRIMSAVLLWVVLVTAFSVMLLPELWSTRTVATGRLEAQSAATRAGYWQEARVLIREHWYQGVGIGAFTQATRDRDRGRQAWDYQPVHNQLALIAAEVGVFGALLFVAAMAEFLYLVFARHVAALQDHGWFAVYAVAVAALLVLGMFEHFMWSLSFGILFFWLVFGLWVRRYQEFVDNSGGG